MTGTGPHKASHTAVAVSGAEEPLGQLRIRASAAQAERLLEWAAAWPERTWAVGGAGGLGHLLAQQLLPAGERVLDVRPKPGARVRLLATGNVSKNDPGDARSAAALRSPGVRAAGPDDRAAALKVWSKRRRDLAGSRTRVVCRLHAVLCELVPGGAPKKIIACSPGAGPADCLTASQCYAPLQFRVAYGIQPLLDRGIDGRGVTVVLPGEAETGPARPQPIAGILQSVTGIRQDLAGFDSRFALPPAQIQVTTTLAGPSASSWLAGPEEVEDTELVHAVAPDATIREVLVDPAGVSTPAKLAATFAAYVRMAAGDGEVMSQSGIGQDFNVGESSWTSAEAATMNNSALEYAAARHLTVVVASGGNGAIGNGASAPVKEASLPASEPLVPAAGGTSLTANPVTGAYAGETAWDTSTPGSGGGFSRLFPRPAYQDGVPGAGATRGVPDVAADAEGLTGMALAFSAPGGGYEYIGAGGTSAAAPFRAAPGRPGRPGGRPPARLRQPGHLPDRPRPGVPQGVPRHHHRQQHGTRRRSHGHRLPGRTRLGPGHRLGNPRRPGPHPPARPLTAPFSREMTSWNR
jgi:hypothetical protein